MDGPQTFLDTDFSKAFAGFALAGFNVEAVVASQRKNIEALSQANQVAVEGVQAVARRHAEITREAIDQASALLRDIVQPTAPEERVAKNAELLKQSFERSLANTRELALILAKANTEAFDIVVKRMAQGFEEFRDDAKKRVAK